MENTRILLNDKHCNYNGEVTLLLKHNDHIYKEVKMDNYGTYNLFRRMLLALAGISIVNKVPFYIRLFTKNTCNPGEEVVKFNIAMTDTSEISPANPQLETEGLSITFNFLVPDAIISGREVGGVLLLGLDGVKLAQVGLEHSVTVEADTSVDILWRLTISNNS